jgi:hypothetical protein
MDKQEPLYELIRSLTQSEKRYFSIYAKRHVLGGQNQYKVLFEAVDKQSKYDETKLLQKFKGQKITKNFSAAKHQLYHLILDSLKAFHADKSIESELSGILEKIKILFDKGLNKQCWKLLHKAKKMAETYECYTAMLDIISWERKLHSRTLYKDFEALLEVRELEKETLAKLDNASDFVKLYITSFTQLIHGGRSRSDEATAAFQVLLKDELLEKEENALSYSAKVFYHAIHANYNDSIGNDEKNQEHQQRLLELTEGNPKILKTNFKRYITMVDNFCISGIRLGTYDACFKKLNQLQELYGQLKINASPEIEARIFTTVSMHQLCIFYRQRKFEKGLELLPDIEANLEVHSKYILKQRKHDLMYDLFYTYFGCGQFEKALYWLNACMNDKDITMRPAEISALKLIEIVVHYELGNIDLMSFLVRNSYRFMLNKGQLFASEALFLKFIRTRMGKVFDQKDLLIFFTDLREELKALQTETYEQQFLDPFDMIGWLDSKIKGEPFGEK